MKEKKGWKHDKILGIIISISFIYLIIIANAIYVTYNEELYLKEFAKQDTASRIADPEQKVDNILNFFKHKEDLKSEDFDEKQVSHMIDVRGFLDKSTILFFILVLYDLIAFLFLVYYFKTDVKDLLKIVRNGAALTLIFIAAVFLLSTLFYPLMFVGFHQVFFKEGTWVLSSDSTLIRLFPFEFFKDMFIYIVVNSIMTAILFLIISMSTLHSYNKQDK